MIVWDIETNGLLDDVSVFHCMCTHDTDTGEERQFRPHEKREACLFLMNAMREGKTIAGHNIIQYDIPALQKLFPEFTVRRDQRELVLDSLVLSMNVYSNIIQSDFGLMRKGLIPKELVGRHSLESWGYRLGDRKGTYSKDHEDAWAVFNEEMLEYCMQDVRLNVKVLDKLLFEPFPEQVIEVEMRNQWLLGKMQRNGFPFDIEKAYALEATLRGVQAEEQAKIIKMIPSVPNKVDDLTGEAIPFIPKRDNKRLGYVKDVPVFKEKDFNPTSRKQVEWVIRHKFGYSPDYIELYDLPDGADEETFTPDKYRLKIDEETFKYIKNDPEAPKEVLEIAPVLEHLFTIGKRLGQLADGNKAWLKFYNEKTGCIHGRIMSNGTVSSRAAHSSPNIGQVPACDAEFGSECRELFNSSKLGNGWLQVGVDASGLELRCLAHYMGQYDNGEYADIILNGDIHTANQMAAGLPTRNNAKTFIYGFLYGAGDAKIGKIVGGTAADGKRLKKSFLTKTPAIKNLREAVSNALVEMERGRIKRWKRRFLKTLIGRPVSVRSPHSALNLLLQSCGAEVCKWWLVETERMLVEDLGLKHGWDGDFAFMTWVHDEFQAAVRNEEIGAKVIEVAQLAMRKVQVLSGFRMQLDTEGKMGHNWKECH